MPVRMPPTISLPSFMGYIKGKSSLMIFDENANLKYNYGSPRFSSEGYYASSIVLNKKDTKIYKASRTRKLNSR